MADFDSSLPIRTEQDGDVVAKIADATTPSQQLKVEADGSINVNADISATDLDIRDLSHTQDSVKVGDGTDFLAVNADGSINITDNGGSITVDASDLDIRDLSFASDKVDVSGSSNVGVTATDLDIRDLSATTDSVSAHLKDELGNAYSSANPLPVEFFESITEAFDHNKGTAIASDANSTHTYGAPANFKLYEVHCSASGKMRAELKINSVIVAVGFNSTANPNITFKFGKGLNASSVNIEVVRTNLDNQAQDLYSTISGASI
jgi:hypothetical protein